MIKLTMVEVLREEIRMRGMSLSFSSPRAKPRISAYTMPMAADSVGVNTPP